MFSLTQYHYPLCIQVCMLMSHALPYYVGSVGYTNVLEVLVKGSHRNTMLSERKKAPQDCYLTTTS